MKKYTKKEIDGLLSIQSSWELIGKQRRIKRLFKKFNARTNTAKSQKEIKDAERMMEVCAQAMEIYKEPPHQRNYQKKVKPKKKLRKKYVAKKTVPNNNEGCLIPIAISISSFGLLIWILILNI